MKKYSLTILLAIAGCLAVPMSALAGTIGAATSLGTVAFSPSKSVSLGVLSNSGATYSAMSGHTQGTEVYGIVSTNTSIFFHGVDAGTTVGTTSTLKGVVVPASETSLAADGFTATK